jgi:hypothetical protein
VATTRDIQEYASSGELTDIKIGGTANSNKVATLGDIPTDILTDSQLKSNFNSAYYNTIYLGGTVTSSNKVATQGYVSEQISLSGGYTNTDLVNYLSNGNDLSVIYIGSKLSGNRVATLTDLNNAASNYSDSDVIDLLKSKTIDDDDAWLLTRTGASQIATRAWVTDQNDYDLKNTVIAKPISDTSYTILTADSGKNLYFTSTSAKTITLSTASMAENVQVAVFNIGGSTIRFTSSSNINGSSSDLEDAVIQYGAAYVVRYENEFIVG